MADLPDLPRPSHLWKRLSPERRTLAAEAFWRDDNAQMEQAEVIQSIAQRIKFRAKSVMAMPREKKARQLVALPAVSELVAARLLVVYHLEQQRPMMAGFLDALGIPHEEGVIKEEELSAPEPEKLRAAVQAIASSHPPDDVAIYLTTLVWQDPETWGELAHMPEVEAVRAG
jgi:hypothetical protein